MASSKSMLRSCALALLAFAALATPALAAPGPNFDFPTGGLHYSPAQVTLDPSDTGVCWTPTSADFATHPLTFDTGELSNHTSGSSQYCADTTGLRPGFYAFHCAVHGNVGQEGSVGAGMTGSFTVPGDTTATPDFTIDQSGASATFTYTGTTDQDPGDAITKYVWDWDGNGSTDTTSTATDVQHTYTANGTFHPTLRVIDMGHVLSVPATHAITITGIPDPTPPSTPPPDGGTPPPPLGGGSPPADTTAPVVKLTLAKKLTVGKALQLRFTTDEPTSVIATLKVGKKTAKARKDFGAPGKHTLTIKLSKALRRLLRHRRTATLTLAVTDDAGNGTTIKRAVKLKTR